MIVLNFSFAELIRFSRNNYKREATLRKYPPWSKQLKVAFFSWAAISTTSIKSSFLGPSCILTTDISVQSSWRVKVPCCHQVLSTPEDINQQDWRVDITKGSKRLASIKRKKNINNWKFQNSLSSFPSIPRNHLYCLPGFLRFSWVYSQEYSSFLFFSN